VEPVNEEDTNISITMTLAEWRVVMAYVEGGIYRNVCQVVGELVFQTANQLEAARAARELEEQQKKNGNPAAPATLARCREPSESRPRRTWERRR
jgi:hypothetical protein